MICKMHHYGFTFELDKHAHHRIVQHAKIVFFEALRFVHILSTLYLKRTRSMNFLDFRCEMETNPRLCPS